MVTIQFVTIEGWGGELDRICPLGEKKNGAFDSYDDAEKALLEHLKKYAFTPCPFYIRKQYVKL